MKVKPLARVLMNVLMTGSGENTKVPGRLVELYVHEGSHHKCAHKLTYKIEVRRSGEKLAYRPRQKADDGRFFEFRPYDKY